MAFLLFAALLPVLLLLAFILRKDKAQPEPPAQLIKAFGLGLLSVIPALLLVWLFEGLGLGAGQEPTVWNAILDAFWGAAIPEELAKLGMLWLVLRRNPYFDERLDGIVYAVCVSLGFAATENVLYLLGNADQMLQVGITRALFAVPGHFCDGVLMGYFYSLACFASLHQRARYRLLTFLVPVLVHGVYDAILFASAVSELLSGVLSIVFLIFCRQLWQYASHRIAEHRAADAMRAAE